MARVLRKPLWIRLFALLGAGIAGLWLLSSERVYPRIDLTDDQRYTLSEGTRTLLAGLEQPVQLWWFNSERNLREAPTLRNYALRVQSMLREMARQTGGKLELHSVDPAPFSVDEDRATEWGIQAVPVEAGQPALYLGVAALGENGSEEVIPFLHPNRQQFLEYDLARVIARAARVQPPVIGLVSSLPVNGGLDLARRTVHRPWTALRELGASYKISDLGTDFEDIGAAIDVLLLIQPGPLSSASLFAIEQFLLSGKPALIFVDPDPQSAPFPVVRDPVASGEDAKADGRSPTDLSALFRGWGVSWSENQVVGDAVHAMLVNIGDDQTPARDLTLLGLRPEAASLEAAITRDLETLNVATAGAWHLDAGSALDWRPLLRSSSGSAMIDTRRLQGLKDPGDLLPGFKPDGRRFDLMGLLRGEVRSAFVDRDSNAVDARSGGSITVLLAADTDMLTDRLWVQVQGFLGQPVLAPFADNGSLLINAVDYLAGNPELITLRGRGVLERPFTRLHGLRKDAERQYRQRADQLTAELEEAERGLAALNLQGASGAATELTPQQQALATQYIDRKLNARQALRDVRQQLNAQVDQLASRLQLANIALVPLLLTLAVIGWQLLRRWRRETLRPV